jgi:glycosyltransferase involved in cell wall biosynthesis
MKITYLGFNSFKYHKRGVENVIDFQAKASTSKVNYYLHWDTKNNVSHFQDFLCIGIKKDIFWFFYLNTVLIKIKKRDKGIFVHSHNPLMSLASIYQTNLFTVHDALYYLTTAHNYKFKKLFYLLEKILYKRTSFVHFISNYSKSMSLYDNKNWVIIPNTSHLENFKSVNDVTQIRNEMSPFLMGTIKILVVRSIEERAQIDLLIKVASALKDKKIQIFIAGKGPLLAFYQNKIKEQKLTNIELLGFIDDHTLVNYYKNSDIVLVPALYGEGFGLPIIEGYLFNKPVIGSNKCAIPEIIYNKDFLFENTVESIIEKIEFVCSTSPKLYKEYYFSSFSNSFVINSFLKLYQKIK